MLLPWERGLGPPYPAPRLVPPLQGLGEGEQPLTASRGHRPVPLVCGSLCCVSCSRRSAGGSLNPPVCSGRAAQLARWVMLNRSKRKETKTAGLGYPKPFGRSLKTFAVLKFFGGLWHCCCSVTFASSSCVQTHVSPTQRAPGSMLGGQGTLPPTLGTPAAVLAFAGAATRTQGRGVLGRQMHLGSRRLQLLCTARWLPVLPTAGLVTPPRSCGPAARPGRTSVLGFYRQRPFSSRCPWGADSERAQQS